MDTPEQMQSFCEQLFEQGELIRCYQVHCVCMCLETALWDEDNLVNGSVAAKEFMEAEIESLFSPHILQQIKEDLRIVTKDLTQEKLIEKYLVERQKLYN